MWSKEQINVLKRLWNRGEPARIIALQLRTTRNAVIGKANRLELPKHPSRIEENEETIYEENNINVEELYQPKICSHSSCTMTAQPGREYCAFHCRLIIEEQKKQKQAS
tara:strand:- start:379 stop:705 length:327 start_codon:yes stop_codon:yes gene_type:complete